MKDRLPCKTESVGPFAVTVDFDPAGRPCGVFITKRGKSGTELDRYLYEIGVAASKMMQGK